MENINLIRKIAWSFHATTGVAYNELVSEATLAYFEAMTALTGKSNRKFNPKPHLPEQSKLTSYYYRCMQNALVNFCKKELRTVSSRTVMEYDAHYTPTDDFLETLNEMPVDCKVITDYVLKHSDEFATLPPKAVRGKVVEYLREEGWSWSQVWGSFKTTKQYLITH